VLTSLTLIKRAPKITIHYLQIDLFVDSTSGHEHLSFMDAFLGYNKISMHEFD
jgi:hypothetical protein